jgi:hypothetical protein
MEKLFTLSEVEKLTGRKVVTLRKDAREGRLHIIRICQQIRVPESNLLDFLARTRKETSEAT